MLGRRAVFLERETGERNQRMISFYGGGALEFVLSLVLLTFVCLIISQMLLSEKTLRSFL